MLKGQSILSRVLYYGNEVSDVLLASARDIMQSDEKSAKDMQLSQGREDTLLFAKECIDAVT